MITAAGIALLLPAGLSAAPASASPPVSAGPAIAPPGPAKSLDGVYCTAAADCWAVGSQRVGGSDGGGLQNQVLHRTGTKWSPVKVPNPGGTKAIDLNELSAIRCISAENCWAVGDYQKNGTGLLNQALHWTGGKWSVTRTPDPAGTDPSAVNELLDVSCAAPADCWAVGVSGARGTEADHELTQALHWNGKAWTQVSTPSPDQGAGTVINRLNSVRCASAISCWAGGFALGTGKRAGSQLNLMLHWTGRKWTTSPVPNPGGAAPNLFNEIFGLSCTGAASCWAAGFQGIEQPESPQNLNELLHWTGRTWRETTVPNPAGTGDQAVNELTSVSCDTAADCWAVGDTEGAGGGQASLIQALHWNGSAWSSVRIPEPAGQDSGDLSLRSIRCLSKTNCWAVGFHDEVGAVVNVILHWTGKRWVAS